MIYTCTWKNGKKIKSINLFYQVNTVIENVKKKKKDVMNSAVNEIRKLYAAFLFGSNLILLFQNKDMTTIQCVLE